MMKYKKIKWSNLIFILMILLFIIPQSRKFIQVSLNKLVVNYSPFVPKELALEKQIQLTPFDYKVKTLDGISVSNPVGNGKVTFISYWATWCPPCIAELPSIEKLYADYGNKVTFLLITNEKTTTVEDFIERKKFNIPAVIPEIETPEKLRERTIPTTYIIDSRGKVIIKEQGAADWNSNKIRDLLDVLLSE